MPLKGQKNHACDCLLNSWSGSNKTCNGSSRARRWTQRIGPCTSSAFIYSRHERFQGFRDLDPWEKHSTPFTSAFSTRQFVTVRAIIAVWKTHSFYNDLPMIFNTIPIYVLLYAGELNNVMKPVTPFTAAIWSWYYTQLPGSKCLQWKLIWCCLHLQASSHFSSFFTAFIILLWSDPPVRSTETLEACLTAITDLSVYNKLDTCSTCNHISGQITDLFWRSIRIGANPIFHTAIRSQRMDPSISDCDPAGNNIMAHQ